MENRIKELRKETGITQKILSAKLDVSQESISAYEMGKYLPSLSILLKMSDIFGVGMDYIMKRSDVKYPVQEDCLVMKEAQLIAEYRKLTDSKQEKAVAYMQGLRED